MENSNKSKFTVTTSGLVNSVIAVLSGFFVKTVYDYFDSKNQFIKNIKAISSGLKEDSEDLLNVVDAISYANQLGRLDLVSLVLALLAIVIGFGAIFGFLHIKETSEVIARDVARETVENHLRREDLNEEKNEIKGATEKKVKSRKAPKNWAADANK